MSAAARQTKPRRPKAATSPAKAGLIQVIHVAKRQLALVDDDYRAVLRRVTGKDSCSAMSIAELEAVKAELQALGFKASPPRRAGRRPQARTEAAGKLRALWLSGYALGVVEDPSEAALSGWVKRVTGGRRKGVEALQWLTEADAATAIEGLKGWLTRAAGVDWSGYLDAVSGRTVYHPERRVIEAQARILGVTLQEAGRIGYDAKLPAGFAFYEAADWTALIEVLGARVRASKGDAR